MPSNQRSRNPIMTAVITGNHLIEVPDFINLFRRLPDIDFYPQSIEDFAADLAHVRNNYEVVLFYNMHRNPPNDTVKQVLETLGETQQGIFALHHGMLAFREWQLWSDIVGIQDRRFTYHQNETIRIEIADPDHPITSGLSAWEMVDETYAMSDTEEGSHVLLTTDHAKSLRTIAWTRQYKQARVFCLASGHGRETYENPSFQTVVARGIYWLAGKI